MVTERLDDDIPCAALEQRHLTAATLVRVSDDATPGAERRAADRIHRTATRTFDPYRLQTA